MTFRQFYLRCWWPFRVLRWKFIALYRWIVANTICRWLGHHWCDGCGWIVEGKKRRWIDLWICSRCTGVK